MPRNPPPEAFLNREITLGTETKTVRQWCEERKLDPHKVYCQRQRYTEWEKALDPNNKPGEGLRRAGSTGQYARKSR